MTVGRQPFSVLMAFYAGDSVEHFAAALTSCVEGQTRRPNEVVLVQDGPIGQGLAEAVHTAVEESTVPVLLIVLEKNRGLAAALSAGLASTQHDIVARMDADDIALPERFERQLPLIEAGHDMVGSGMFEIDGQGRILGQRIPPTGRSAIAVASRLRDPFNHPTVVYRRSAVERAGGYNDLTLMEDYLLFAKMIHTGASVDNLPDPLVLYRVDEGAYDRRGGIELFRSELALQRALHREGFIGTARLLRNIVVRGGYRFVPTSIRRVLYRAVYVSRTAHRDSSGLIVAGHEATTS